MRDTMDMLREAGWASYASQDERFKAFEALVRADERSVEREACILELERNADKTLEDIIAIIRARGNT